MNYIKSKTGRKRLVRVVTRDKDYKVTYDVVYGDVEYIGDILGAEQLANLRRYGNTLIGYQFYKKCIAAVGKDKLLAELNELAGKPCRIEIKDDPFSQNKLVLIHLKKRNKNKEVE